MTSAVHPPTITNWQASKNKEALPVARIASSAVTDSTYASAKEKPTPVQGTYIDNHLAKMMYCLPISESKSLPENAVKEKSRITSSDHTSTIADLSQNIDDGHSSSSGSSSREDNDRGTPRHPVQDVDASEETKSESVPHPPRCECGCIPKILSLFEMAELRRKHRERLKSGDKSESTSR